MTQGTESARVEAIGPKLLMARKIADSTHDQGSIAWCAALDAALAAIDATTQAAIQFVQDWPTPLDDMPMALRMRDIAISLTANRHLEPRHD